MKYFHFLDLKKMTFTNTLAQDMKEALDNYFVHLKFECYGMDSPDETVVFYTPPFYCEDKCNESLFGLIVKSNSYPLICSSEVVDYEFTIQSKEDWKNHIEEFVSWVDEYKEIIKQIRS